MDQQLIQHIMGTMIDSLRDEESFRTLTRLESWVTLQLMALVRGSHSSVLSVLTHSFREGAGDLGRVRQV